MFESLKEPLRETLKELALSIPTPIQQKVIPLMLQGRDVIGQSRTGSGKTLAFALPVLNAIELEVRTVQALVICPTRELAAQVAREFRKFGRRLPGLTVLQATGGEPVSRQNPAGAHVIIGTPGRLVDHLQRGGLDFSELRTVVLDEADRMLDMGFEEQVMQVLDAAPSKRQTACFSATFPDEIAPYLRDAVRVDVEDEIAAKQYWYALEGDTRQRALLDVLGALQPQSALVFCNAKLTVSEVEQALLDRQVAVACLHGDMEQPDRDRVMARFRNGSVRVLVATDVAARGLDVPALDLVVNFDIPISPEMYVHRVGRTARAGKQGVAVTFVGPAEKPPAEAEKWVRAYKPPAPIAAEAAMITLHVTAGKKDKVRAGDILGALTSIGLTSAEVGKIEIHERFSYVAIAKGKAVPDKLKIKGRNAKLSPVKP